MVSMPDDADILVADQLAKSDVPLHVEEERALEAAAQSLREPLIDQLNWCTLLTTDSEPSLHAKHLELVAKINRCANDLLGQVQDLLDVDKIQERIQAAENTTTDTREDDVSAAEPDVAEPEAAAQEQIPAEAVEEPVAEADPVEVAAEPIPATGLLTTCRIDVKVLIVEGSSNLRDLLAGALGRKFHVLTAADGWEALQLMVERPDVIVAEVNLARVDFLDMVGHARRIVKDVAVLAIYDEKDGALVTAIQQRGIRDVMPKPLPIAAIVEKVEALAASRRTQANKSVLMVSSDTHEAHGLFNLLDARYRTHLATSMEAAREASSNRYDLIVVDSTGANDWWQDVVTLYRSSNKGIRVLAMVDSSERDIVGQMRQLRVTGAICKPYSCDDLLERIRGLLGIEELEGGIMRGVIRRAVI